ncbi:MAG: bifunctional serine/threonine-protein kinase/formylglycine-generating enzyme family protein [Planctomycetota bacterium]
MGPLAPGSQLGGYTIDRILGQGGMGAVYAARDAKGIVVALKVLPPEASRDKVFVERFRREALAAVVVDHLNIARCLGTGEDKGVHFLALELVPGGSLEDRLKKEGRLGWKDAARIGAGIAHALAAIHEAGLIHRDLKPGNVLLDAEGGVKVTDFGIARRAGTGSLTKTGEFLGTPDFMAPEQALAAKKVDGQADLYSLGALLHCLVTGTPPFTGSSFSILQKHATATPPRVKSVVPEASADFDALVFQLLGKEPAERGEVRAVAEKLEALGAGLALGSGGGGAPRALLAVLVLVAVGLGAVAFSLARRTGQESGKPPAPVTTSSTTATPSTSTSTTPPERDPARPPAWFDALPAGERPTIPLPAALRFGDKPGEYLAVKDPSIVFLWVPAGTFEMGDTFDPSTSPFHTVELTSYFIGRTEVTVAQFRRFARSRKEPLAIPRGYDRNHIPEENLDWEHPFTKPYKLEDQHPVVQVTWNVAMQHARSLGATLPSEAQWERAAGWDPATKTARRFAWGDEIPGKGSPALANLIDVSLHALFPGPNPVFAGYLDGYGLVAPVGNFPRDTSPAGIVDATGNVRELCLDAWDPKYFDKAPRVDPVNEAPGTDGGQHSTRGGSWGFHTGSVSLQERTKINHPTNCIGYRLAVR